MANATGLFKVSNGLRANYDLLASKDANTMYVCHGDTGYKHGLFVDGERVAVDGKLENLTGANAGQVTINIDGDTATVYNTTAINNMISSIISGITWKGDISVANLKLVTNYKVGWLYRIKHPTNPALLPDNPWTTTPLVDLEDGDYVLCINNYNSAFSTNDFVIWERNLTGAITCINGINGWTDGTFNPICAFGGAGGSNATEVAKPSTNTNNLFLKYIDDGDPTTPTAQLPNWSAAVEPDNYPTAKLTNHAIIVGRGEAKVAAIGTGTAGNILYSGGANADPVWLANSSTDGYVLKWSNSAGHPIWAAESGGGGGQGDGNTEYDLPANDEAGYVPIDSFDATQGGAAIASGKINIFRSLNSGSPSSGQPYNDEGIIIYAPDYQQSFNIGDNSAFDNNNNVAYGKTSKIALPPTNGGNGLLFFNSRVYNQQGQQDSDPSFVLKSSTNVLDATHTGATSSGQNTYPTEGAIVDALTWGTF